MLDNYTGGILCSDDDPGCLDRHHNHGVSIVGWGYDDKRDKQHWIVRNSWGHYWGERRQPMCAIFLAACV